MERTLTRASVCLSTPETTVSSVCIYSTTSGLLNNESYNKTVRHLDFSEAFDCNVNLFVPQLAMNLLQTFDLSWTF